jgi:amidase
MVHAYEHKMFTSVDLIDTYLARIREVDHEFRSVVQVSPTAIAAAQALDAERIAKGRRGPLHGIPILIKEIFQRSTTGQRRLVAVWR